MIADRPRGGGRVAPEIAEDTAEGAFRTGQKEGRRVGDAFGLTLGLLDHGDRLPGIGRLVAWAQGTNASRIE